MIINRANLDKVFTGVKTIFNEAFKGAESEWEKVATRVPSGAATELYGWLQALPGFREWVGDRVVHGLGLHDYSIKNKKFEMTVGVPRDNLDDDTVGVFTPLFAEMGRRSRQHPDRLVFDLLKNGFAGLCYDGQPFFDADHPVTPAIGADPESVSNDGGGANPDAWYLLDTRNMVKPLIFQVRRDYDLKRKDDPNSENVFNRDEFQYGVDARVNGGYGLWQLAYGSHQALNPDNYQAARSAMMSFKDDAGQALGVMPNRLVVPPALEGAGLEVLKAERLASGATNVHRDTAELLVVPWLA